MLSPTHPEIPMLIGGLDYAVLTSEEIAQFMSDHGILPHPLPPSLIITKVVQVKGEMLSPERQALLLMFANDIAAPSHEADKVIIAGHASTLGNDTGFQLTLSRLHDTDTGSGKMLDIIARRLGTTHARLYGIVHIAQGYTEPSA